MKLQDKNIVITGGANGIGLSLAKRFHHESPKSISLIDINKSVNDVATDLGVNGYIADVTNQNQLQNLLNQIINKEGSIDLFCSNAGIQQFGTLETSTEDWQKNWDVNVMSHIYAAKVLIPHMQTRKSGYILLTVSAAGLLNMPSALSYATTKHAAMGLAENLSIMYGNDGIVVSALCPQLVDTNMVRSAESLANDHPLLKDGILSAEFVAEETVKGINSENFLILPHKEVAKYIQGKAFDYDAWIQAVRKMVP
ncbi:MAG: SDR family oxidoreductase [Rickettsiales bacterium TMED289]|nr:MAG: SDR family oxidoreductase [Rickettsiales bacterium TMED289]|tara:strand:+ start:11 stop:772 length:762 start_codon:yes stop_codon:yes gene_type:complete